MSRSLNWKLMKNFSFLIKFNQMIERLKEQQNKLLINERYEAWESVASLLMK